ncbi:RBMS1 protein, partial [Burhinus bistriatus]|nr:RBMS1 protein [Burhinus bistriatus]
FLEWSQQKNVKQIPRGNFINYIVDVVTEATFIPLVKCSPQPDPDPEEEESSPRQADKNVTCLVKLHTSLIPERLHQFEAVCAAVGMESCFRAQETAPFTNTNLMQAACSCMMMHKNNYINNYIKQLCRRIRKVCVSLSVFVSFTFKMKNTEVKNAEHLCMNATSTNIPSVFSVPAEPLLCKFADGGQKKRQNQNKYIQNGRAWHREGEAGMTLTYDPTTAALQNGFYPSPYSITANRMITQTSITPYIASPVSTYQVQSPSWMQPQPYIMQHPGAVLTPSMDHTMSLQPASMISPLTQQMSHLSLGSTGTYMPATTAMQGAYIPQYTHVQTAAVPVEEASGQQQVTVETSSDHSPYTYQQNK